MGTRNITCVCMDGETKVAQYCQWDGYPSGQGVQALKFLHFLASSSRVDEFKKDLLNCEIIAPERLELLWQGCGKPADESMVNMEISEKFKEKHPQLNRDMGADVMDHIFTTGGCELSLQEEFAADSVFCEWGYVVDLDTNQFEVYSNREDCAADGRFAKFADGGRHSPIGKVMSWSLDELPTTEEFLSQLEGE